MKEDVKISTLGMNCPKPLIETRKALRKLTKGQVLVVEGDHEISKSEIPQAVKDTGDEVLSVEDKSPVWIITIRKG
ncbi:MAG: sulfurtransferase TusA family protein [Thermoplasmata archaeon]|nr:sulfurtransferase TusA family protein [Thermoplasmata archaeon]